MPGLSSGAHIEVSAPAKLFLLGEYSVLEGGPALLTGLTQRARVSLRLNSSGKCVFSAAQLGIHELSCELSANGLVHADDATTQQKLQIVREVFTEALSACPEIENHLRQGFTLNIDTSEFFSKSNKMKLGLGSSAAVAVSLCTALLATEDEGIFTQQERVYRLAQNAHQRVQKGRGSGADIGVAIYGGVLTFQQAGRGELPSVRSIVWPDDLEMLAVHTGKSVATGETLARLDIFREKNLQEFEEGMTNLKELAAQGLEAFKAAKGDAFLAHINAFQDALEEFGDAANLSEIQILPEDFQQEIRNLGGAAKISGAGGDVALIFYPASESSQKIFECAHRRGFKAMDLRHDERALQGQVSRQA
ncbi:MAG: hypothetical protein CMH60_03945 [Myxococcales bacterium]|nr:hypothetical protein [Myxococcales bacterium]